MKKFAQGNAVSVRYRNRRIGEFLKEIDLSEKKSTGIKKVLHALKINGSPEPLFETDTERSTMFATIFLHEGFEQILTGSSDEHINEHISEHINEQLNPTTKTIFLAIKKNPQITIEELIILTKKSRATVTRSIKVLRELEKICRIGSNKDGYWSIS
ncbi:hypothetical protein FACS18947_3570 [Bacteroidia bacterium]|nr:hypothetical protein FACS18947_3570 [Bacteroidia bacterium]